MYHILLATGSDNISVFHHFGNITTFSALTNASNLQKSFSFDAFQNYRTLPFPIKHIMKHNSE